MFTHLHVHTEYSILDGYCKIKALVSKAKALGQTALAITDHGYMYGVMEFYNACKSESIKPIIGVELYTVPFSSTIYEKSQATKKSGHITLLAKDNVGYQNLIALDSIAATDGMYYRPRIDISLLQKYHTGIICLSGCLQGDLAQALLHNDMQTALRIAQAYKEIFGEDYYIELQYHGLTEQKLILPKLIQLANMLQIRTVATNDVHYIERSDAFAQRILKCISTDKTIDDEHSLGYGNPDHWYLKSEEEMLQIFGEIAPEAIENTTHIMEQCNVELDAGCYHLPSFSAPSNWASNEDYFIALCRMGLAKRYGDEMSAHEEALMNEIKVISEMGFIDYFLIVFDIIRFAKSNHIEIGPGRGSAAGSIVSYCLGITDLDPIKYGLLFERFLNPERITLPDIDIDIAPEGRPMVIDYIVDTYGADHVSQIISFGTLGAKSAFSNVAKVMKLPKETTATINRLIPVGPDVNLKRTIQANKQLKSMYVNDADIKKVLDAAMSIEGIIRNTSTHAAGIIISPDPLQDHIPYSRGKDDTTILASQFDMGSIEAAGMLKIDLLDLKTLTVLKNAETAIQNKQAEGERLFQLNKLKLDDPAVYTMLSNGYTNGVFQLESPGMQDVLRKIKPSCFEDLIAAIALYRPGPMEAIPDFIQNKHHPESITYIHPKLEPILHDTYSVIVYQEQVMGIVRTLAGYSYGRADLVRRAMAKKKPDVMAQEKDIFIYGKMSPEGTIEVDGCIRRGITEKDAIRLWDSMTSFAAYAFNRSHAACYALLAYRAAFLRCHYPLEFMAALLTNALGDSKRLAKLMNDCDKQGIIILPPDINASSAEFTVENGKIRFGLRAIKNAGTAVIAELTTERRNGPFLDLQDVIERTIASANKNTLSGLIQSGAMDSFHRTRAELLGALPLMLKAAAKARKSYMQEQLSIEESFFSGTEETPKFHFARIEYPKCAPFSLQDQLEMEMSACGMYISGHPLNEYKAIIERKTTHTIGQLHAQCHVDDPNTVPIENGQLVRVAGVIKTKRNVTTKTKCPMAFLSLEDQTGTVDVTVFPKTFISYGKELEPGAIVIVIGKVEQFDVEIKIIAESFIFLKSNNAISKIE